MIISRWGVRRGLLAACLVLAGCADAGRGDFPPRPAGRFEEMREEISRLRGLPFVHQVTLETKTPEELRSLVAESIEGAEAEKIASLSEAYRRLGLIPESADLAKSLLDVALVRKAVYYDSRGKKIVAPGGPVRAGPASFEIPWPASEESARQLLLAQALARALQEQNFHWSDSIQSRDTRDRKLTLRAVTRGDAMLVGLAHLLAGDPGGKEKIVDGVRRLFRLSTRIDRQLSHLPELARAEIAFEYLHGSQFVLWAYFHKGWQGVNALFAYPPASTAQILHPEKYYMEREEPLQIVPWRLLSQFGSQLTIEDTLGEYTIRLLLGRSSTPEEAERIAAGWSGDTLLGFREGEQPVLAWITAWGSSGQAREFFAAYRRALEQRHRLTMESAPDGRDMLVSREGAHPLLLQIRSNFVFFLDGLPAPRSIKVAAELWDELETNRELRKVPFELVDRSQRLSSPRK
jgi:hypothetical protein